MIDLDDAPVLKPSTLDLATATENQGASNPSKKAIQGK
jgi:hypothetical protein